MLRKWNNVLFYLSLLSFFSIIALYFIGILLIVDTLNYLMINFGFISLFLAVSLTKNSPFKVKLIILSFILFGALFWISSIFKFIPFEKTWKYALLFIFIGIIIAIWNKVYFKSEGIIKYAFLVSTLALTITAILTCFSFFDNDNMLFYSLLSFTTFAGISLVMRIKKVK